MAIFGSSSVDIDKWRYTLYTTFVLLLIFNSYTFKLTNSIFKHAGLVLYENGHPTKSGCVVHVIVFTVLIRLLMELKI